MNKPSEPASMGCKQCQNNPALDFDFAMALQPIINVDTATIFAQEALVRGLGNQPAGTVFAMVNDDNRYTFDQTCRIKAIELAARLGIDSFLSINFMPNAVYQPQRCIQTTLNAARHYGFPLNRILFEIVESEHVEDRQHVAGIINHYKQQGFTTALDDFGAGYAGLNMLADLDVDIIKIDMDLIRNIDTHPRKQAILRGIVKTCDELGIRIIAEGVETAAELDVIRLLGIHLVQGYLLARPCYEGEAEIDWSQL